MSNSFRKGVKNIPNPRDSVPTNDGSEQPEKREAVGSHAHGFFHQKDLYNLGQADTLLDQVGTQHPIVYLSGAYAFVCG